MCFTHFQFEKKEEKVTIHNNYKLTFGCVPVHLARNFKQSCKVSRRIDLADKINLFQSSLFAIKLYRSNTTGSLITG